MGKKEEDAEFAAMMKRLGVKTPKSGWSSQKSKKLDMGKKEEGAEFAAMMKRLGVKTPKDGWGKGPKINRRTRATDDDKETKRLKRKLEALGPSVQEMQRTRLRDSSTEELKKEKQELKNTRFKPRTDVYGSIDLPNEIKQRELGQEAIGAKSGGVIRKNKTTKGYNTGGKVTTLGVGRAVQKKIRPAKMVKMKGS